MEKKPSERVNNTYKFADLAVRAVLGLNDSKITASGLENLPTEDAYILAYTHHNSWDAPALGSVIYEQTKRPVYFMAKEDLLDNFPVGSILKALYAMPVSRNGRPNLSQIRQPIEFLRHGRILGIAPEGGRINGDKVTEIKGGVGMLAIRANVDVVPVGVSGINPKIGRRNLGLVPRSLHIHFGEAITPNGSDRKDRQVIDEQLRIRLQSALDEAYSQYETVHGPQAASKLDRGLTKLF